LLIVEKTILLGYKYVAFLRDFKEKNKKAVPLTVNGSFGEKTKEKKYLAC